MAQPLLFETRSAEEMRRDRMDQVDRQVMDVLCGRSRFPVSDRQIDLLRILRSKYGMGRAVQIGELAERININPRTIKEEIRGLVVDHQLPIGASRDGERGGYYLITTPEEAAAATADYKKEIVALARRVRVLEGQKGINELLGQLRIEEETHHAL